MRHYGYITIQASTGRYYIGIHSTARRRDGYLGSGRGIAAAIRECGRADFRRRDVMRFPDRQAALDWEAAVVTQAVVEDPNSFNRQTGGGGAVRGRKASAATRARMSATRKGRVPSAANRAAVSAANKGKRHTPEARARMSAAQKKRFRKPISAETRARMVAAAKARCLPRKLGEQNVQNFT